MKVFTFLTLQIICYSSFCSTPKLLFTSFRSDAPEQFGFVFPENIVAGRVIYFSDRDWDTVTSSFTGSEGVLRWEATADIESGQMIFVDSAQSVNYGTIVSDSGNFNIANTNDIVWAYELGADGSPLLIGAIATSSASVVELLADSPLGANEYGVFSNQNGYYNGSLTLQPGDFDQFYTLNWSLGNANDFQIPLTSGSRLKIAIQNPVCSVSLSGYEATLELTHANTATRSILCYDTIPISGTFAGSQFIDIDTTKAIEVELGQQLVNICGLLPHKQYYFRFACFTVVNNAIVVSPEVSCTTPALLAEKSAVFPDGWEGDTSHFVFRNDSLLFRKDTSCGAVFFDASKLDAIDAEFYPWQYGMSSQNYIAVVVASDRVFNGKPTVDYWNGLFMRIGQTGGSIVTLQQRTGRVTSQLLELGVLNLDSIADAGATIVVGAEYLSTGDVVIKVSASQNGEKATLFSAAVSSDLYDNRYWGLSTNLRSIGEAYNVNVKRVTVSRYMNSYRFNDGDFFAASSWIPSRTIPYQSDQLFYNDVDSLVVDAQLFIIGGMELENSSIYFENTDSEANIIQLNGNLQINQNSSLVLTNSIASDAGISMDIAGNATIDVYGTLVLSANGGIPNHTVTFETQNALVVHEGGIVEVRKEDGYPFSAPEDGAFAIFESGSEFIQYDGKHPFGSVDSMNVTEFQPGSVYRFIDGGLSFSDRVYSHLIIEQSQNNNIQMGADDTTSIDVFDIRKGCLLFGLSGNKSPVHLSVSHLFVDEGAEFNFSPTSADARSFLRFSDPYSTVSGDGIFVVGENAVLGCSSEILSIHGSIIVNGEFSFAENCIARIDSGSIYIPGNITGCGASSYFSGSECLSDSSSFLIRPVADATSVVLFPVGTESEGYSPMVISNNSGEASDFRVRVFEGIYDHGLYGGENSDDSCLDQTWEITPDGNAEVDVQIFWSESVEKSKFFRDYGQMIINHHVSGDDEWSEVDSSHYLFCDGMHSLQAFSINRFSTVSGSGSGSPLALYFTDFGADRFSNSVSVSWLQTVPVDSVHVLVSRDALTFTSVLSVHFLGMGAFSQSVELASETEGYIKMLQFKQGEMVESSGVVPFAARPSGWLGTLAIDQVGNLVEVNGDVFRSASVSLYSAEGVYLQHFEDLPLPIFFAVPSACKPCVVSVKSGVEEGNRVVIYRE